MFVGMLQKYLSFFKNCRTIEVLLEPVDEPSDKAFILRGGGGQKLK
jgi:hypothetical protein